MMQHTSRTRRRNRRLASALTGSVLLSALVPMAHADGLAPTQLVTGKMISPVGTTQNVGSLPMNMILTPDGKYALVSDMGFREYLTCLNAKTGRIAQPDHAMSRRHPPTAPSPGRPSLRPCFAFGKLPIHEQQSACTTAWRSRAARTVRTPSMLRRRRERHHCRDQCLDADRQLRHRPLKRSKMKPGDFPAGLSLDKNGLLYVAVNENYQRQVTAFSRLTTRRAVWSFTTPTATDCRHGCRNAPEKSRAFFFNTAHRTRKGDLPSALEQFVAAPVRRCRFTPPSFPFAVRCPAPAAARSMSAASVTAAIYVH